MPALVLAFSVVVTNVAVVVYLTHFVTESVVLVVRFIMTWFLGEHVFPAVVLMGVVTFHTGCV